MLHRSIWLQWAATAELCQDVGECEGAWGQLEVRQELPETKDMNCTSVSSSRYHARSPEQWAGIQRWEEVPQKLQAVVIHAQLDPLEFVPGQSCNFRQVVSLLAPPCLLYKTNLGVRAEVLWLVEFLSSKHSVPSKMYVGRRHDTVCMAN